MSHIAHHQWHLVCVSLNFHCKHVSRQLFLIVFHNASLVSCSMQWVAVLKIPICLDMYAHTCSPKQDGHSSVCTIVCFSEQNTFLYLLSSRVSVYVYAKCVISFSTGMLGEICSKLGRISNLLETVNEVVIKKWAF